MSEPRDVIADAVIDALNEFGAFLPNPTENHVRVTMMPGGAEFILAALRDAGFEIVQREEPVQKPEPDWGRRGTQPKGKLGPPPPPNGKRVASKPLPPTPGPFNPFGKQDLEGIVPSPILTDAFGEPTSIEEVAPNTFKYTWTDDDVESP